MNKFFRYAMVVTWAGSTACCALAQIGMDQININGQFVMAARAGRAERAGALLSEGAKVDSRDRNGDSALNMAAAKGNMALVDLLLKAGADVNLANVAGVTPLMAASFRGNADIVHKVLAAGAKVEPIDRIRKNAATYAAGSGCTPCLGELLRAGTPVNGRLENDLTLLMWAASYGHESTVKFLLEQGADKSLKDNRGKSAADIARDGNQLALSKLLEP